MYMNNHMDMLEKVSAEIDRMLREKQETERVIVALEGPCGSGKTTLAAALQKRYDCNVFAMDDFFLRPEQRTQERYAEIGGNVDYERFSREILAHLGKPEEIRWKPFDCRTFTFGKEKHVPAKRLNIVEGAYSCHPYFGEHVYDLRFFIEITEREQQERILRRDGREKLQMFTDKWIPYENQYFDTYAIREKCILV